MNYYKGLIEIGESGEYKDIPTELLKDYISDFNTELNSREQVKKLNIDDSSVTIKINNDKNYGVI